MVGGRDRRRRRQCGTISDDGLYTAPTAPDTHTITATSDDLSTDATVYVTDYAGTFTAHNDNFRTGAEPERDGATPANVNTSSFGKLFSYPLDG